jgi:hypothetical protein
VISRLVRLSPLFFLVSVGVVAACSSSSSSDDSGVQPGVDGGNDALVQGCSAYAPPAGTDLTTPTVSFRNDVLPIMAVTCALSDCHAYPGDPQTEDLILGVAEGGVDEDSGTTTADGGADGGDVDAGPTIVPGTASAIVANIVGVSSKELTTMNRVTASDPSNSFLQHKIDGDNCLYTTQCVDQSCGDQMPDKSDQLSEASRLIIRRWIAQGAKDN